MMSMTKGLTALAGAALFTLGTFGATNTASAIPTGGCTTNADCPTDYHCTGGSCELNQCNRSFNNNGGTTAAIFDSDPGDYVVVTGQDLNTSSTQTCSAGAEYCSTSYTSRVKLDMPECDSGMCGSYDLCLGGPCGQGTVQFRHEKTVSPGKYYVIDTGLACSTDGGIITRITPCNC